MPRLIICLSLLMCFHFVKAGDTTERFTFFRGNVAAAYNPFNPKVTAQLELPIRHRASYGLSLSYYLINWEGPLAEPFIRVYGKRHGNEQGSFFQFKLSYGNLSTLNFNDYNGALRNECWNTFGFGLAYGYKFNVGDQFTIEPLGGFRFLTPPYYRYYPNIDESFYASLAEGVIWYVSSGLPLDLQVKFGYQF
jgi:hypothetical protein